MSVIELVGAILLIICCVAIIILVLNQDSSKGLSQSLTGSSNDNFFQKNSGRTKEATLKRITKVATVLLFVVTISVNIFAIFGKSSSETETEEEGPTIDISDQLQVEDPANPGVPIETVSAEEAAAENEEPSVAAGETEAVAAETEAPTAETEVAAETETPAETETVDEAATTAVAETVAE